jgi:histidine triad (HIT) family protein
MTRPAARGAAATRTRAQGAAAPACVLCEIAAGWREAAVVAVGEACMAIMDVHPVKPGHVLVIPRTHHSALHQYPGDVQDELFRLGRRVARAPRAAGLADAATFFLLDRPASGQRFAHVHLHVLPRHRGDLPRILFRFATRMLLDAFGRAATPAALRATAERIRARLG